jgi:hypothetical protein
LPNEYLLTRDPVFQLNACLWLVRKPTFAPIGPKPTYAAEGFVLRAIGRKLGISPQLRTVFLSLGWTGAPPEPDVLIMHAVSRKHLVLECKASSFSSTSSTAMQARKLLALCADPDVALGSSGKAFVVYVLSLEDAALQLTTLMELTNDLQTNQVPSAESGTLGLKIEDGGLWATLDIPTAADDAEIAPISGRVWVTDGDESDARPLYIVPYDPTAADNQSPEERSYCTKQLTERVLTYAMATLGRAGVPDYVRIVADDALKQATFNTSSLWAAHELDKLRTRIAAELYSVLNRGDMQGKVELHNRWVDVNLATLADQATALNLLLKAQPQEAANRIAESQLRLTDPDDGT